MEQKFKILLALLIVVRHNMQVLHWRIRGVDFDPVHDKMGEYYEQLSQFIDDVAEMGMELGIAPVDIFQAVQLVIKQWGGDFITNAETTYTSLECFSVVETQFAALLSQYEGVYSLEIFPADIQNKLQEHAEWVRKQLRYKNRMRLA